MESASQCDHCGEIVLDIDAGFSPGLHAMKHECGGTWRVMTEADHLRKALSDAGLSQRGAARALDIDERTMRRYCSGELSVPKMVWLALDGLSRD